MTALNDIPDYLKADGKPESSPSSRLVWGTLATVSLATAVGLVLCWATLHVPSFTHHWLLGFAGAFLTTLMLFGVMHRIAGIVPFGNSIAIATACLLVVAKYIALLVHVAHSLTPTPPLWTLFSLMELFITNITTWVGIAFAAILARNGDFGLEDLLDILMVNPLTGHRQ